jgi:small-conductance mechanosensitive channel
MWQVIENILYYPFINLGGFKFALINVFIFAGLFLIGKLLVKYLKRFYNHREIADKRWNIEGKEIPVWRLTKQIIWIFIIYIGFKSLSLNNSNMGLSNLLDYEFFRFDEFHFAVYHIFIGILIYFSVRIFLNLSRVFFSRRARIRESVNADSYYVYFQLVKYVVIVIGIIFMMRSLGVVLSTFIESLLAISLAIALGLQEIFKDFFSGLLLLFEGNVKMGEIIEIEREGGRENFVAKILEINVRTSKIETRDGKVIIIPNSQLTFQKVNNWSTGTQETRFMIPVTVHYKSDIELVKRLLIESAQEHPKVSKKNETKVRLLNFGESGYEFDLIFWADKTLFIEIHKSDIRFAIDKKFKELGIQYPYPQMDVHFDKDIKKDPPTESL